MADGAAIYNAAAIVAGGEMVGAYRKICLPNYAVFDEKRYFTPGDRAGVLDLNGTHVGLNICEDIWEPCGPTVVAAREGDAGLVINLSMSPYHVGKGRQREAMLAQRARDAGAYVCYVNGVGGQDELVFDGQSFVFGPEGDLIARAGQFEEQLLIVDLDVRPPRRVGDLRGRSYARRVARRLAPRKPVAGFPAFGIEIITVETASADSPPPAAAAPLTDCLSVEAEVYAALCLGVGDYVRKNRFEQVVMGISGGIDSALTACLAADALGSAKVNAVSMPSRYSSSGTKDDARETAERLGVNFSEIAIETIYGSYLETLVPHFRRRGSRGHRAEHPGTHPGQYPHGALEQVRLPGAHDG